MKILIEHNGARVTLEDVPPEKVEQVLGAAHRALGIGSGTTPSARATPPAGQIVDAVAARTFDGLVSIAGVALPADRNRYITFDLGKPPDAPRLKSHVQESRRWNPKLARRLIADASFTAVALLSLLQKRFPGGVLPAEVARANVVRGAQALGPVVSSLNRWAENNELFPPVVTGKHGHLILHPDLHPHLQHLDLDVAGELARGETPEPKGGQG